MIRIGLCLSILCIMGTALAQNRPDPIWQEQAREKYEQALEHKENKEWQQAVDLILLALQDDASKEAYHLELAHLYQELREHDRAIETLEKADRIFPDRAEFILPLVDHHLIQNSHDKRLLLQLQSRLRKIGSHGAIQRSLELQRDVVLRQAKVSTALRDDSKAGDLLEEWRALSPGADRYNLEMAAYHHAFGRQEQAIRCLEKVHSPAERADADELLKNIRRKRYQTYHPFLPPNAPLPEHISADLLKVEGFISQGRFDACNALLHAVYTSHPTSIRVLQLRGDCFLVGSHIEKAELYYLRALSMNPSQHDVLVGLAALHEGQKQWSFVIEYADRALELPTEDLKQLHVQRIRAYQALHRPNEALRMVKLAIDTLKQQEDLPLDDLYDLEAQLTEITQIESQSNGREILRDPIVADVRRLMSVDAFEDALALVERTRPAKRTDELHALHGQILFVLARYDAAITPLKRALESNPNMVQANLTLAKIYLRHPETSERARPYLEKAARAGSIAARVSLIQLDARPAPEVPFLHDLVNIWNLVEWSRELDMLAQHTTAPKADIHRLKENLEERIQRSYIIFASMAVICLTVLFLIVRRRFGGATLHDLMDTYPTTNPETHRVISAIRHEVLKHNSTALQGVLQGMENGDDVQEQADWCYRALVGSEDEEQGSAYVRLKAYVDQLQQLGKTHGLRMNLKYKDPAIAPILNGFQQLTALESHFAKVAAGGPIKTSMIKKVRKAAGLINGVGFREILHLLKALRNLTIDESICREIFNSVRQEPAFSNRDIRFQFDADAGLLPLELPIAKEDFEDILRNPMRNAIQATAGEHKDGPIHVGLDIRREIEMITGEVSTVFLIKDRCTRELSSSDVREAHRERGLGMTRTLVTKYDGTLEVSKLDSPWSKGLAISLPWDEAPAEQWEL